MIRATQGFRECTVIMSSNSKKPMRLLNGFGENWKAAADHDLASTQPMAPVTECQRTNCPRLCCLKDPLGLFDGRRLPKIQIQEPSSQILGQGPLSSCRSSLSRFSAIGDNWKPLVAL